MKEVIKGILEAIEDEIAAQEKYRKLKQKTDDKQARALFEQLIKDEEGHEQLLRSRYQALKQMIDQD